LFWVVKGNLNIKKNQTEYHTNRGGKKNQVVLMKTGQGGKNKWSLWVSHVANHKKSPNTHTPVTHRWVKKKKGKRRIVELPTKKGGGGKMWGQ